LIYIGIDPDIDKNGFAVWDSKLKHFQEISDYRFFDMLKCIECYVDKGHDVKVVVEAGWLNKKSNFHGRINQSKQVGEKIAKSVGANHQVGKFVIEYCKLKKIDCLALKPLSKKWGEKGNEKINAEEFKKISGWSGQTNPEKRDAAMLVIGR